MRQRSDQPLLQPTPAPGIWFPANEDTTCPECNGPPLSVPHQCQPKAN